MTSFVRFTAILLTTLGSTGCVQHTGSPLVAQNSLPTIRAQVAHLGPPTASEPVVKNVLPSQSELAATAYQGGPVDPFALKPPALTAPERPLPINLPTAFRLGNVQALDIAIASQRLQLAATELDRTRVLWLPSILVGADYNRHDGQAQNFAGDVSGASKGSFMVGAGPNLLVGTTDAIFAPLVARQELRARQAEIQTATNDTLLAIAESYFDVQQARGELAGATDAVRHTAELVRRTEELAPGLIPPVEISRAKTELARRKQAVLAARERWRIVNAELLRVLRMEPTSLIEPVEPPQLKLTLMKEDAALDDLIPLALTSRPELASQQALVQATLARLRQERARPLIPYVLIRGNSTSPGSTLAGGYFGGGPNAFTGNFGARADFDLQLVWQLDNLGFGYAARVAQRRGEHELTQLEFFRAQDRIIAEVSKAHAQLRYAQERISEAQAELKHSVDSVEKNFEGLGQTKKAGNLNLLVIRPQEAVAAVQAMGQAYNDYFSAIADYNRAQFRLYRALGRPAQHLLSESDNEQLAVPAR